MIAKPLVRNMVSGFTIGGVLYCMDLIWDNVQRNCLGNFSLVYPHKHNKTSTKNVVVLAHKQDFFFVK